MVEFGRRTFSVRESGLSAPEGSPSIAGKREIKAVELFNIFGFDVRAATEKKLINLGILSYENELQFSDRPFIHTYRHKDGSITKSDSQYFLETVIGEDGVLAAFIPPSSKTSQHEHEHPIRETYNYIAGSPFVRIGNEDVRLSSKVNSIEVPLNKVHQVTTTDIPAFILIVMKKAGLVPRDQWHKQPTKINRYQNGR